MLHLPNLLPLKPSTPSTGLNPTHRSHGHRPRRLLASSAPLPPPPPPRTPNSTATPEPLKPEARTGRQSPEDATADLPTTKPRKPRRGRRGEVAAVEDFVRGRLEQVFASIREHDSEVLQGKGNILKRKEEDEEQEFLRCGVRGGRGGAEGGGGGGGPKLASGRRRWVGDPVVGVLRQAFDQERDGGRGGDRLGRRDRQGLGQGDQLLGMESFAFHPSPLVVLVFERYNRAADN